MPARSRTASAQSALPRLVNLRPIWPLAALVIIALVSIAGALWFASNEGDEAALRNQNKIVQEQVREVLDQIVRTTIDTSWWNDAVTHLALQSDRGWADHNLGEYLADKQNLDLVEVLDAEGDPVFNYVAGKPAPSPLAGQHEALRSLMARSTGDPTTGPVPAAGYVATDGDVFAIAVAPVLAEDMAGPKQQPSQLHYLVAGRNVGSDILSLLQSAYGIADARVERGRAADRNAVPLVGINGEAAAFLTWQPDLPGRPMRLWMLPAVIGALVVFSLFSWLSIKTIRAAMRSAIDSELEVRRLAEDRRLEQLKTEFVSTVSHELRTPLASIIGAVKLLRHGRLGEADPKATSLLELTDRNSQRLMRLVDNILDMEKLAADRMEFLFDDRELNQLVQACVEASRVAAARKQIELALEPAAEPAWVKSDRHRFDQALGNIIGNAIKFSPPGSLVQVSVEVSSAAARVSVTDTGPGIPQQFQPALFDRFTQADASDQRTKGGTGLGLHIARGIVERHGGRIGFTTGDGGTIFWVELPRVH